MISEVVKLSAPSIEMAQQSSGTLYCKFVLIAQGGFLSLIFGPVSVFHYHANLVSQFCRDRDIAHNWIKQPDVVEIGDPAYRVLGGGYLDLDFAKKRARFYGSSKAYGYYDLAAVKQTVSTDPYFAQFSIQIDS